MLDVSFLDAATSDKLLGGWMFACWMLKLDVGCLFSGCCHVGSITWWLDVSVLDA